MREDLLCAACGGRVVEARCPTCRHSREVLREQERLPAAAVLLVALALLLLLVVLSQRV